MLDFTPINNPLFVHFHFHLVTPFFQSIDAFLQGNDRAEWIKEIRECVLVDIRPFHCCYVGFLLQGLLQVEDFVLEELNLKLERVQRALQHQIGRHGCGKVGVVGFDHAKSSQCITTVVRFVQSLKVQTLRVHVKLAQNTVKDVGYVISVDTDDNGLPFASSRGVLRLF